MRYIAVLTLCAVGIAAPSLARAEGDPERGRESFRVCATCHSVESGRHMTGPSLADIWGRRAGTVEGFERYSPALEAAQVTWDESSLDAWLRDPRAFLPGNTMTFRGIADDQARADVIAYLRALSSSAAAAAGGQEAEGAATERTEALNLRTLAANNRITSLAYCGDSYTVTTENGETHRFWEFNLRFKTDGSANGPEPGRPVIIPAGMMGDRAFIVFAGPQEFGTFITLEC